MLLLCAYDQKPSAAFLDGDLGLEVNCSCTRRFPQQARIHSVALRTATNTAILVYTVSIKFPPKRKKATGQGIVAS